MPEAETLRNALQGADEDSDVFFSAMAATSAGIKQLGVGFINLKEMYLKGLDLAAASVHLKGSDERRIGSVDVSVTAVEALHRAYSPSTIRLCVGALELPLEMTHDANLHELRIEIDLLGLAPPEKLRTKVCYIEQCQVDNMLHR